MARDPAAIAAELHLLLEPDARQRLLARGLARGLVWRNGVVPAGGPSFSEELTEDLLDFGYGLLALALELRDANADPTRAESGEEPFETRPAFLTAAESIESAVRRGDPTDAQRGLHLVVAAAAFHLAGYAARSFTLVPAPQPIHNLSSAERALALLLRRDVAELRSHVREWLSSPDFADEALAGRLADEDDEFGAADVVVVALTRGYLLAMGLTDTALYLGDADTHDDAIASLERVVEYASRAGNVPVWWVATLSRHLFRDLWGDSLHQRLPRGPRPPGQALADDEPDPDGGDADETLPERWSTLRRDFVQSLLARQPPEIDLWPSQTEAASRATDPTDDLVVSLPTSSGKTRIAELCILRALADSKRVVYITPLRALSAQVEKTLGRTFIPLGFTVTSLYGASGVTLSDTKTLADADIVVATPEKLDFAIRQDPDVLDDVALIVFDEGHMIGVGSREIRYEVLIQRLLRRDDSAGRRIVCLSAMFDTRDDAFADFCAWLRSDEPGESIQVDWRPTRRRLGFLDWQPSTKTGRLDLLDGEKPFVPKFVEARPPRGRRQLDFPKNDIEFCIAAANAFAKDGHNVLVYSPQRNQVEPLVREFSRVAEQGYLDGCAAPAAADLEIAMAIGREWLGADHPAVKGLLVGVGTHHAALPRPFLSAVEDLLKQRKLPIVVASPTLAQGIDLACGVLLFRSILRFNGPARRQLPIDPAEFSNVLGRAGRAFVDLDGLAIFPVFDKHARRHGQFRKLVKDSGAQQLWSGLARLVYQIALKIQERLGIEKGELLEYVLNQPNVWNDARLLSDPSSGDEDESERGIEDEIADLDLAIFSLVDPLDTSAQNLAKTLDTLLQGSLWQRTMARYPTLRDLEVGVLGSRARWLWHNTTLKQRKACFNSGLGQSSGVFLYDHMDALVDLLVDFQRAIASGDVAAVGVAAVAFAEHVTADRFFSVRKPPTTWKSALLKWVTGVAFSVIVDEDPSAQAFIQDGVIFKLVWAAEAVRVQAVAVEHGRVSELGDGPAMVLTYGVPTVEAALLCQSGFASRVGAVWATSRLSSSFANFDGMRAWVNEHEDLLYSRDFWPSEDAHLLWSAVESGPVTVRSREWIRTKVRLSVDWTGSRPAEGETVRVVPGDGRSVVICGRDLAPLGTAEVAFDPTQAFMTGDVRRNGQVSVEVFGPSLPSDH